MNPSPNTNDPNHLTNTNKNAYIGDINTMLIYIEGILEEEKTHKERLQPVILYG